MKILANYEEFLKSGGVMGRVEIQSVFDRPSFHLPISPTSINGDDARDHDARDGGECELQLVED